MAEISTPVPCLIAGETTSTFRIAPMYLVAFSRLLASAGADKSPGSYEAKVRRARIVAQVRAVLPSGAEAPISSLDVMSLPIPAARALIAALTEGDGKEGEILSGDGDGVATGPILYKLGVPISASDGSGSAADITELEFHASTYGQVEDVLAGTDPVEQTLALLRTVARPPALLMMPTWAIDFVSIADGVKIAEKVLPRFLG